MLEFRLIIDTGSADPWRWLRLVLGIRGLARPLVLGPFGEQGGGPCRWMRHLNFTTSQLMNVSCLSPLQMSNPGPPSRS